MKLKKATCPAVEKYVSQKRVRTNQRQRTIGKDNVCYRKECFVKWHWAWPKVVLILAWHRNAHIDHGDQNSREDTDKCYRGC